MAGQSEWGAELSAEAVQAQLEDVEQPQREEEDRLLQEVSLQKNDLSRPMAEVVR